LRLRNTGFRVKPGMTNKGKEQSLGVTHSMRLRVNFRGSATGAYPRFLNLAARPSRSVRGGEGL